MTVRNIRINPITEADVGKWLVPESPWRGGFCHRPALITKVSKTRVYYRDLDREYKGRNGAGDLVWEWFLKDHEEYRLTKTIVFVADTQEEAMKLYDLSSDQENEITVATKAVQEKYRKIVEQMY